MLRLGKISQVRLDINRMFILDMHLRFNAASNNQGAFLQEFFGNALADTGTCAGDNYHFIFKSHHLSLLSYLHIMVLSPAGQYQIRSKRLTRCTPKFSSFCTQRTNS